MSKKNRKADSRSSPGPPKPEAGAGPVRPDEEALNVPPGEGSQRDEEPGAPPAAWLELTRSAGPPAHWLELFGPGTPVQAGEPTGLESEQGPEATPARLPEPRPGPPQILARESGDQPPTMKPGLGPPSKPVPAGAPISQAPGPADRIPPPRLRLHPVTSPSGSSPAQKPGGGAKESRPGILPAAVEPAAPKPGAALPPASPLTRLRLHPPPSVRQPAETVMEPASALESLQAASSLQEPQSHPAEPAPEEEKGRGTSAPGPTRPPSQEPGNFSVSAPPEAVPSLTEQTAIIFPPLKPGQPPAEPQWSEPSDAHWPALPDPLPRARLPEQHGISRHTLRSDHSLRLNQEQKGKPWNA